MDGRIQSLDDKKNAQCILKKDYFSLVYQMDAKVKVEDSLRTFCKEFGVTEKLSFDGSK